MERLGAKGRAAVRATEGEPSRASQRSDLLQPIGAGFVTAIVGFASSFSLVIAGLRAVGADRAQAASGLLVLCVLMGLLAIGLGIRYRQPISIAWSTPGAALLVSVGLPHGGYREALGAFVVAGLLTVLTGLSRTLTRWIASIPAPLSSAMLAGVLLPICLAPVQAAVHLPRLALPAIVVWVMLGRFARRWAVPGALAAALAGLALDPSTRGHLGGSLLPRLVVTTPGFSIGTLISLAVPLYLVTMASQNLPGVAVLKSHGYDPPVRQVLIGTGAATALGAAAGALSVNFAAITAALAASPDAHRDPRKRWIASTTAGAVYVVAGLGAGVATALLLTAPPLLIEAVAGLALLGALGNALTAALADATKKEPAVATFVVTASGTTVAGIGAPFWGLLVGLALTVVTWMNVSPRTSKDQPPTDNDPRPVSTLPDTLSVRTRGAREVC
jgi:benzoate membrane transport protein